MNMEMKNKIRVEMEALSENEGLARTVAASFAAGWDPTMEELTEIKTAISEAVSNAIIHAYPEGPEGRKGKVILEMAGNREGKLIFTVEDQGIGIGDVKRAREPLYTTGDGERSGMGFTVMESFMDRLDVESTPGRGTRVTMIKVLDITHGQ